MKLKEYIDNRIKTVIFEQQISKKYNLTEEDTIKNPETGNTIKVSSALSYPKDSKVHQLAQKFLSKFKKNNDKEVEDDITGEITDDQYNNMKAALAKVNPNAKVGSMKVNKKTGDMSFEDSDYNHYVLSKDNKLTKTVSGNKPKRK